MSVDANPVIIACPRKCWSCMLGQCPAGPHGWADQDDALPGEPIPPGPCGCPCVREAPADTAVDTDVVSLDADPCPVCGAAGECGSDGEGRPMIHAIPAEMSHD